MKQKGWKRLGVAVLILTMLLSLVPGAAFAEEQTGEEAAAPVQESAAEVQARTDYRITVEGGHAECERKEITAAAAGTWVDLRVEEPEGKAFSRWVAEQGDVLLINRESYDCTFQMPAEDVTIRAEFVPGHKLTVEDFGYANRERPNGHKDNDVSAAAPGDQIEVGFDVLPEGMDFSHWVVTQGTVALEQPKLNHTTFPMPDEDVVIRPEYQPTGWRQNDTGRWYVDESGNYVTGWQIVNGFWFYFEDNGYMYSGWLQESGKWYYFGSQESMSDGQDGSMATGPWWIDGQCYGFDLKSGEMMTGWQYLDDAWYYFNDRGHMMFGWQKINGYWYYFSSSGEMQTDWQWIDGKRYYFHENGRMAAEEWIGDSYVDASGAWVEHPVFTGWQSNSTGWWYNDETGNYVTGWQVIHGYWYYFASNGYMQTGWQQINGYWYYFSPSGDMQTGWQQINGYWYYFSPSGDMQTGWQWIDGSCYYFYPGGWMATDTWINGSYVNGSGVWVP